MCLVFLDSIHKHNGASIPGSIESLRVLAGDDVALPRCPHGVFSVLFVFCRSVFVVSRRGGYFVVWLFMYVHEPDGGKGTYSIEFPRRSFVPSER